MPSLIVRQGRSLKWQLIVLSLALLIPTLLFVGVLLWRFTVSEQRRTEEEARGLSHALAVALDREMVGVLTTLQALATSPSLLTGNTAGFYEQISEMRRLQGIHISLRDTNGHTVLTTRATLGAYVPVPERLAEADREVLQTGKAKVTDLFTSATASRPVFQLIAAPVIIRGVPTYLLGASIDPDYLAEAIGRERLPRGWIGVLMDRNNTIVARTLGQTEYVGKTASPDFRANASGDSGSYYGRNIAGKQSLVGYSRSSLTGWTAAVNISADKVAGPMWRSLYILFGLGVGLMLLAAGLASLAGWRVNGAMRRLRRAAESIGQGQPIETLDTSVAEVNEVGQALEQAGRRLERRARERDAAEAALRALTGTLETQVAERTAELEDANQRLRNQMQERAKAEEALRQSQKMEAVGQLTGGIAHDFNNLLTGIIGSLDLMQTRIRQGRTETLERYVVAATASASRAAALTHRLLAFARRQPLDPRPVDGNALVANMADLLRRTLTEDIRLQIVTAPGLWLTLCDPHQLENALLNLAINARDAMTLGGHLTVETANAQLDEAYTSQQADVQPGQYVCVSVTDTGSGMPASVAARAFEPFFTTKPQGQGTGLGLSMIYGFARQSAGHVSLYSESGHGTTVKLYLPRYTGDMHAPDEVSAAIAHHAGPDETVLVVEDEPVVRDLVVEVLEDMGYRILQAADGQAGLAILRSSERIDLVITDVGLPGLDGRVMIEQARESRAGLRTLFITGYAENAVFGNGTLAMGMQMITKPFTLGALAERIQQMLAPAGTTL